MNNDFTVDGMCSALNTSRPTIYRMIKAGEIHAYKIRNSTRIPYSELARIQNENQIKPTHANHKEVC
jgi:excisionase family DNA binding protein